ncbi:MAG: hypothetical protein JO208_01660 [Alphaproteobacteria bacterium]|nr:hypothetical protein [Alphaproteobacteria bacterium]
MSAVQSALFAEEEMGPKPKAYVPNPNAVRNRLRGLLQEMREAEHWPWQGAVLQLYRDIVPPQLYAALPDAEEAARWRAEIGAEAARLDAAV